MTTKQINQNFIIRLSIFRDGKRVSSHLVGFTRLYWVIGNDSKFWNILERAWKCQREYYKKKITGDLYVEFITRK